MLCRMILLFILSYLIIDMDVVQPRLISSHLTNETSFLYKLGVFSLYLMRFNRYLELIQCVVCFDPHPSCSPPANTKGNKRSRTRNDSYTAGQSVGESGAPPPPPPARPLGSYLNNAGTCLRRGPRGDRPGGDHAQETGEHRPRVDPLLQ